MGRESEIVSKKNAGKKNIWIIFEFVSLSSRFLAHSFRSRDPFKNPEPVSTPPTSIPHFFREVFPVRCTSGCLPSDCDLLVVSDTSLPLSSEVEARISS